MLEYRHDKGRDIFLYTCNFKEMKNKLYSDGKFDPFSSNVWTQLQQILRYDVSIHSLVTMVKKIYFLQLME